MTFDNLRQVNFKLNPDKCVFGILSGKLLGFLISHRGIEANPDKIKAIERMEARRRVKDVQRLNGCITTLGRFISMLGERALPFFKLLKKSGPVEWTPEAEEAIHSSATSPHCQSSWPQRRRRLCCYTSRPPTR